MPEAEALHYALPIRWEYPEGLVTRFANNAIVQRSGQTFIVSFFEVLPPVVVGSPEEQKSQVESLVSVAATCVARIVIPADQAAGIIKTMQEGLEKGTMLGLGKTAEEA